jgi:hypothetical protein
MTRGVVPPSQRLEYVQERCREARSKLQDLQKSAERIVAGEVKETELQYYLQEVEDLCELAQTEAMHVGEHLYHGGM